MNLDDLTRGLDLEELGRELHALVSAWYPICRSITGEGLREQLRRIGEHIPLQFHEVATGTPLFDWTAPLEWNIRDAYVKDAAGHRVVDFQQHNLHVLGYSTPVKRTLSLEELKQHCHTLPDHPGWIPYRTSYYREQWGFCLAQRQLDALAPGEYEVCIDSTLMNGSMTYAECVLPGSEDGEFLFSAHACHPSLANDNLSGLAIATCLAKALDRVPRRLTYRFVFAPGTIGAIAWLAQHEETTPRIRHGLVLACLGDKGHSTYKKSRGGDAAIDRCAAYVLAQSDEAHDILEFTPYGYDERQYGSPGFNLPVGCFMRTPPGRYPEYHTSADNPDLVKPESLADSFVKLARIVEILENDGVYRNLNPKCEPQLGKRGLYTAIGGRTDAKALEMAMLWVLNYSDGAHSLLDIARKSRLDFAHVRAAADALLAANLLEECHA